MANTLSIANCILWDRPDEGKTSIYIKNGKINALGKSPPGKGETLNAKGLIAAPGFIDVHLQGAGGADILDEKQESLAQVSCTVARFGTTAFLATTIYRPRGNNKHLQIIADNIGDGLGGAAMLGIHLEGPFISAAKKGMITSDQICDVSPRTMREIEKLCCGHLRMMTLAPEKKGALPVIKRLVRSGCVASFGHSSADYAQTLAGIKAGINHCTHFFNAMHSLHHRAPGPVLAILDSPAVSCQLLSDGHHLHPGVLRFAVARLGIERCINITDGFQAMGLPQGRYSYDGIPYSVKDGTAQRDDGTLVGTAMGQAPLLARLVKFTRCSFREAVVTATENPARLLGLKRKGRLAKGYDADVVILDEKFNVAATVVNGRVVYGSLK